MADKPTCRRLACTSGLPATYGFLIEPASGEEADTEVFYCAPCVAFNITQDWFTRDEVDSLRKL